MSSTPFPIYTKRQKTKPLALILTLNALVWQVAKPTSSWTTRTFFPSSFLTALLLIDPHFRTYNCFRLESEQPVELINNIFVDAFPTHRGPSTMLVELTRFLRPMRGLSGSAKRQTTTWPFKTVMAAWFRSRMHSSIERAVHGQKHGQLMLAVCLYVNWQTDKSI